MYKIDSNGNYIQSYGQIGLGINEFKKANDFEIDSLTGQIIVLAEENTALYYYELKSSRFIKKVNTGIYGNQFLSLIHI